MSLTPPAAAVVRGWQLAETAGDATPYARQHLLGSAVWSADAIPTIGRSMWTWSCWRS